jgi:gliding motility-associated-like protein
MNLKLKIINQFGCENTSQLVVNNQPTPVAKISLSDDNICLERPVQVFQDTTSYAGAIYTWNFDNPTSLSGTDKGPYSVTWNTAGLKQITMHINLNGCIGTVSRIVFVNPFSMVHLEKTTNKSPICELDEVEFIATPSYYKSYEFIVNNDTIQKSSSNIFKTKNLKNSDVVKLHAIDRVNCPCHTITTPINMNITPLPNVTITSTPTGSSICMGDTIKLTASPSGYDDYHFYDGNVLLQKESATLVLDYTKATGDPIRVLAFESGCMSDSTNPATYVIPEIKKPLKRPQIFCGKTSIGSIKFLWDSVPGATDYEISLNGGAFEPVNGTLNHEIFISQDSTVYAFLKAKGNVPCGDSEISLDSASCKSLPCTAINFVTSPDTEICEGQSTIVSIKDITIPNFEIYWNKTSIPSPNRLRVIKPTQSTQYYVSVKNTDEPNCPMTTKYIDVTVHKIPTVSLISSITADSICESTRVTFTAQSPEYQLYEFYNNYDIVQSGVSPYYTTNELKDLQEIRVRATHYGCRSELSNPISYRVIKKLKQTQVVCGTTSVNSVNFLWDPVPGATGYMISVDSVGGVPNFINVGNTTEHTITGLQLGDARTLTVKPYSNTACSTGMEYASATCFTENCYPLTFDKSQDLEICSGDTATLYIHNVSVPYYSVSWNAKPFTQDTLKKYVFTKDTIIMVSVRNNSQLKCNASKKYFKIKVHDYPVVSLETAEYTDTVCSGSAVTFVAKPSGFDEYFFYDNWNLVQAGPSPVYVCNKYYNQHEILVRPKNNGCLNMEGTSIKRDVIKPLDPPQVNCGKTTTGYVEFVWDSIPGANGYMVSVNDNTFIPANGTFSHTVYTTPSTQVLIEVVATGNTPCGTSLSSSIWSGSLTMCETKPCEPINFTRPENFAICAGQQANLEIQNLTEPTNYSISWKGEPETTSLTYSYKPLQTDTASIIYWDKNQPGCFPARKYTVIDVYDIPVTNLIAPQDTVCQGDNITIESTLQGMDTYDFYSKNNLLYSGNKYWLPIYDIQKDTSIYLTVNFQGCTYSTDVMKITSLQLAPVTLISSAVHDSICENASLILTAQAQGYENFAFYRNDSLLQKSAAKTYSIPRIFLSDTARIDSVYVYGYNFFGCKSKASNLKKHTVLPKTNITISTDKSNICLYEDVQISVLPNDLMHYMYMNNAQPMISQPMAEYVTNKIGFSNKIEVLASNEYGCFSDTSNAIILTVAPVANPTIVASDTVICIGETIQLQGLLEPGYETAQFHWHTGAQTANTDYTPSSTNYAWVYTIFNNCKSLTDSLEIEVDQVKPAIDSVLPITACIGSTIELPGNGGMFYQWFPADSVSDPTIANPTIKVMKTQIYTFVVTNTACVDSSKILVNMDLCLDELPYDIPQIITPNNDGVNDTWNIMYIDYFTQNSVKIYNRWGELVYSKAPYDNTWNGKNNTNKELPNGTYFYNLELGPNMKKYSGFVIINK